MATLKSNSEVKELNVVTTMNGEVINSNVSKEVEKKNFLAILSGMSKENLVTNSGMGKENIYKKEVFESLVTERDKKTMRRKLRDMLENFVSSAIQYKTQKNSKKLISLKKDFKEFYETFYRTNDYSLSSLTSSNKDAKKKEYIQTMLNIFSEIKEA